MCMYMHMYTKPWMENKNAIVQLSRTRPVGRRIQASLLVR